MYSRLAKPYDTSNGCVVAPAGLDMGRKVNAYNPYT